MRKLIPILCVFLSACIFDSSPPTMSGVWEGSVLIGDYRITAEYVVTQTGTEISGIGKVSDPVGSIPLRVEGVTHYPQVRLYGVSGFVDLMYYGEFDTRDRLKGYLVYFGVDIPMVLERM